jgi:hypothetical protein
MSCTGGACTSCPTVGIPSGLGSTGGTPAGRVKPSTPKEGEEIRKKEAEYKKTHQERKTHRKEKRAEYRKKAKDLFGKVKLKVARKLA